MVLRLGQSIQCVQGNAQIVERFDVVGIDAEGLTLAFDSLRRPPVLQRGEAEIGPRVGAVGGESKGGAIEGCRLGPAARIHQVDRDRVAQIGVDFDRLAHRRMHHIAVPRPVARPICRTTSSEASGD